MLIINKIKEINVTGREVMRKLSKLGNDQLDMELCVYFRDLDRYFDVSSFEISEEDYEKLELDQPFLVT
jgi:hypothetical protein